MTDTRNDARTRVVPVLLGATRVALGLLWLNEGLIKYRSGFGAVDIRLVVDSAASNPRVPAFFQAFAETVLGSAPGLFGVLMPLLETSFGVILILGIFTLPVAYASIFTLMTYWLADQLVWQYPVMVLLSALVLLLPAAARRLSVGMFIERHLRRGRGVPTTSEGPRGWWL